MDNLNNVIQWLSTIVPEEDRILNNNPNIHLLIYVSTIKQLKEILLVGNKRKLHFLIQSQGKNWGYTFIKKNDVILNLHKLNKIKDFDEKMGYITLEPGVTFQQVYEFLKKKKSSFMLSVTGSSPQASIMATTLERGIGKGITGDLFAHCCGLEVLLPSGKIVRTGFSRFKNSKTDKIYKWGVGPYLDGLFSQSSFGIVIQLTMWLIPKPIYPVLFTFSINNDTNFKSIIDTIRFLKLNQVLQGNFLIGNQYRFLTEMTQYPWEQASFKTPLPKKILRFLMKETGLMGKWTGQFMIYGLNKEIAESHMNVIKKHFSKYIKLFEVLTPIDIELLKKNKKKLNNNLSLKGIKNYEESVFLGVPQYTSLKSLYWRKKHIIPNTIDPIRDKCGVMWINSVLPMEGNEVVKVLQIVEKIMLKFKFEPNIGFNFITERVVYLIGTIIYDGELEEECINAINCYKEINNQLFEMGYYPYRKSGLNDTMQSYSNDNYSSIYPLMKKIFDPENLLRR